MMGQAISSPTQGNPDGMCAVFPDFFVAFSSKTGFFINQVVPDGLRRVVTQFCIANKNQNK
jgi:hypothetical protein